MADDWKELPFSEAVLLNPATPLAKGSVYPFVEMSAITAGTRDVKCSEHREFAGGGSRFQDRDTLMARITPCLENGKLARFRAPADEPVGHGSTEFIVIRGRPNVSDNDYAYYLTVSPEVRAFAISQMTGTSGRQRVPTDALGRIAVPVPPLGEQKAIAAVLGTLDDKIELNRRMNATLEAMARALFQSWFVDFDPVRAKLDGRPPAALDPATAALFPASFQESSLGPIPHGWRAAQLEEIATVGSGKRPEGRGDVLSPECNIPLYGGGGRMGYVPSALYDKPILFTGRVGTLGLIFRTAEPSWPSDNTLIVEPQPELFDFTYFVLKGFDLITLNRGSTQPLLTQTDLKRQSLVLPTKDVVKAFADLSEPIFRQMVSNERESRTLASLRDTLLPKLLSGELSVAGVARKPEANS
ncbi:MAG: restriction endonuclease subunit S [Terrimicrobiaceae bacterium]